MGSVAPVVTGLVTPVGSVTLGSVTLGLVGVGLVGVGLVGVGLVAVRSDESLAISGSIVAPVSAPTEPEPDLKHTSNSPSQKT